MIKLKQLNKDQLKEIEDVFRIKMEERDYQKNQGLYGFHISILKKFNYHICQVLYCNMISLSLI